MKEEELLSQCLEQALSLLKNGMRDRKHPFRFCVLATAGKSSPQQRYVVLRDLDDEGQLMFFTDGRSAKVEELVANPNASVLFYHPDERLQVRVEGQVKVHKKDAICEKYRPAVKGETWKAYGSILAPGTPIEKPDSAYEWSESVAREHFIVLCFTPGHMEVLQLDGVTHKRAVFNRNNGDWDGQWLVP